MGEHISSLKSFLNYLSHNFCKENPVVAPGVHPVFFAKNRFHSQANETPYSETQRTVNRVGTKTGSERFLRTGAVLENFCRRFSCPHLPSPESEDDKAHIFFARRLVFKKIRRLCPQVVSSK